MRCVVPYAGPLRDAVADALDETGCEWEPCDVSGSDRAYYDLLYALWEDGKGFLLVEHDIVVHHTALRELADCDCDWGGFPHEYVDQIGYGLGCVKFTDRLIARNPDALDRVGVLSDENHPRRHWCRLDAFLQGVVLPSSGETRCPKHVQIVKHLGVGTAHGCN